MIVLKEKEADLIRLSILEGILCITDSLKVDFNIKPKHLTVHQNWRLSQIEELLYTLFSEVVEENGILQSKYDKKTII